VCGDGTGRRVFGNGARVEAADFAAWAWEKEGSCWVGEEGRLGAWTGQGFIDQASDFVGFRNRLWTGASG
jgi:hypothetical protein